MMRRIFDSSGPEQTRAIARRLGALLEGREILGLVGDLGTGKTAFVRGLAEGLAIDPTLVYSPTFTLVAEYSGRIRLRHIDLYRLREPVGFAEAEEIGLAEVLATPGVIAIEWFDRLDEEMSSLVAATLRIEIEGQGEERHIAVTTIDAAGERLLERLSSGAEG